MPRVAIKLTPKATGGFSARKRVPNDVRQQYQLLYGKSSEEWFSTDAPLAQANVQVQEWAAEIGTRISNIRRAARGEGQSLTRLQSRALAGEWYRWFIARHSASPEQATHWEWVQSEIRDELRNKVLPFASHSADTAPDDTDAVWESSEEARRGVPPYCSGLG